jgi:hypothetical protein
VNAVPTSIAEPSLLPGFNCLLLGPTGTGKTYALGSLVDAGLETFVLFTEPGLETLLGYWTDRGQGIPERLHWHILPRPDGNIAKLADSAQLINTVAIEQLSKMQDPQRHTMNQYVSLLRALCDFPDDRTGQKFGAVDKWGPNRALVIDSLSGINPIAFSLIIGNKPIRTQQEWGLAQDQIEKLLRNLTDGIKCHFVLTAHVERETDMMGYSKLTVSTLGKALAPKIPPLFSDVILTVREGTKFSWSTANSQCDLKARNLPIADGILPSFKPIIDKWLSRGGRLTQEIKK